MTNFDYTAAEAADVLEINISTVYQQCRAGKFMGAYKTAGRWWIPPSALEDYRANYLGRCGNASPDYLRKETK